MSIEVGKEGFCRMTNPFISKEEHAYWEGVASRQAEVCKLQTEIDELQEMYEKQGLYAFELQETVSDQLLRIGQLEKKVEQLKCQHFWIGKSENQYCSKCGMID